MHMYLCTHSLFFLMKVSPYSREEEKEVEAATELFSREVKKKKVVDVAALQKALAIAKEIKVPTEVLLKVSSGD